MGGEPSPGGPLLVVGVGRSGTSLVQSMLHAHPALVFLPETHFLRRYVLPPVRRAWWHRRGPERLRDQLDEDAEFTRAGVSPADLLAPFVRREEPFHLAGVYRRLLELYGRGREVRRIGDKDPRLLDFLPGVARLLPDARVVHVIRDPRDVLLSRREAAWSRGRSDLSHMIAYRAQLQRGRATGRRWHGERYLEVHYEELLREPEGILTEICRWIGLTYDPAMLSFADAADDLMADEERQWKKETTGPLRTENIGNWKGRMQPRTRRRVEKLCIAPFPDLAYAEAPADAADGGFLETARRATLSLLAASAARVYPLRTLLG